MESHACIIIYWIRMVRMDLKETGYGADGYLKEMGYGKHGNDLFIIFEKSRYG